VPMIRLPVCPPLLAEPGVLHKLFSIAPCSRINIYFP
jgi:hypothetical protein